MRHFLKSLKSMAKNAGNWIHISVPESIKKPVKSMAKNAGKKKNKFVNWILSCIPDVPEPIKEPVNETLEVLEQQHLQKVGLSKLQNSRE